MNNAAYIPLIASVFVLYRAHRNIKKTCKKMQERPAYLLACTTYEPQEPIKILPSCSHMSLQTLVHELPDFETSDDESELVFKTFEHIPMPLSALNEIKVSSVEYDKFVLTFNEESTIGEVLLELAAHKCSSAIVTRCNVELYGILDTTDIATYILEQGFDTKTPVTKYVRKLAYVYPNASFTEVAHYLKSGLRYIIVKGYMKHDIISQGSLLRYLYTQHHRVTESVLHQSIEQSGICKHQKVISINESDPVRDAFALMLSKNITSLPLMDEDKCCGILSMSDIRLLSLSTNNVVLKQSCSEYVKARTWSRVISCTPKDSLMHVLQLMIETSVHHIYVMDADEQLVGIVSYIDVIRVLF